jgi:hypothetical protein
MQYNRRDCEEDREAVADVQKTEFSNIYICKVFIAPKTTPIGDDTILDLAMDKLNLTEQNLGGVFNSRLGCACICHGVVHKTKQPNLKLKTRPKELLGSLPLAFALPALTMTQMERIVFASRHPITVLACLSSTYKSLPM